MLGVRSPDQPFCLSGQQDRTRTSPCPHEEAHVPCLRHRSDCGLLKGDAFVPLFKSTILNESS
eukprot:3381177-Pyramimonas_sp.AAC.1